jgi:hypothetical protein
MNKSNVASFYLHFIYPENHQSIKTSLFISSISQLYSCQVLTQTQTAFGQAKSKEFHFGDNFMDTQPEHI